MAILCALLSSSVTAESDVFERQYLLAVQRGDLSQVTAWFESQAETSRTPLERQLYGQFQERFITGKEDLAPHSGNPLVDQLVLAFRNYWVDALMHPEDFAFTESRFRADLETILAQQQAAVESAGGEDVFERVAAAIRSQGFHLLSDRSPPFQDLIVWKAEERKNFDVELTDGMETVSVVFMDEFISQGWSQFASLGLLSTSGWASDETLYCVRWAYDPDSRDFRVSYLQHEARHFADYRLYPGLDEEELEYRAKLTELAFVGASAGTLLSAFSLDADALGPGAHARANSRVVEDMYQEMFGAELPAGLERWVVSGAYDVNPAARVLLERNSAELDGRELGLGQGIISPDKPGR